MRAVAPRTAVAQRSTTRAVAPSRAVTVRAAARAQTRSNASDDDIFPTRAIIALGASLAIALSAEPALAGTVFAGNYYDPNHPGCPRSIDERGTVRGLDPVPFKRGKGCRGVKKTDASKAESKFKAWKISGKISRGDDSILIDFNAKDGSGEKLAGKWDDKRKGILFPDGTLWRKLSDEDAWTPR